MLGKIARRKREFLMVCQQIRTQSETIAQLQASLAQSVVELDDARRQADEDVSGISVESCRSEIESATFEFFHGLCGSRAKKN